jgi:hypothetical protein
MGEPTCCQQGEISMNARGTTTRLVLAVTGVLLFGPGRCVAQQNVSWNVAGPAPWSDALNWDVQLLPEASFLDSAVIGNGGTAEVDETVPDVIGMSLNNGTVNIGQGGSLRTEEATTIGEDGTLRLSGNGSFRAGSLSNAGLLHLAGNNIGLDVDDGFTNQATGALSLGITSGGSPVVDVGGTAQFG